MTQQWPSDWDQLIKGHGCEMCANGRPERDRYGVRIHQGDYSDAYLQRADIQRGYTVVIWRGRHVNEPVELTTAEANGYFSEVLLVARAVIDYYQPLKMNYETLGNSLPHLHTHLVPRYREDPRPGQPFPLLAQTGQERSMPDSRIETESAGLRSLIAAR